MKIYGATMLREHNILLLPVILLTLMACSNTGLQSGQPVVNEKPPLTGEPAKLVTTVKGSVYAFSFDENGHRVTCQTPVELDETQQIVPQKQWSLNCSQPTIEQINQPAFAREFNLSTDTLFDFGKSGVLDMKAKGRQSLEQFAALLRKEYNREPQLVLTGYTDRIGTPEASRALALARAQSVAEILRRSGISQSHISAEGKGSEDPLVICPGDVATPELINCLQPNRRMHIQVIGN